LTEYEWLCCENPHPMMKWLHERGYRQERKFRLFAVACCRRIWSLLADERSRWAVEVSEAYADGSTTASNLAAARYDDPNGRETDGAGYAAWMAAGPDGYNAAIHTSLAVAAVSGDVGEGGCMSEGLFAISEESRYRCSLLWEIVGPLPFRELPIEPLWRTQNVIDLARTIYELRSSERMPILADALLDASCTEEEILRHCRSDGPHVRGCWVVDLILGKS
jgi:hypothetical protein